MFLTCRKGSKSVLRCAAVIHGVLFPTHTDTKVSTPHPWVLMRLANFKVDISLKTLSKTLPSRIPSLNLRVFRPSAIGWLGLSLDKDKKTCFLTEKKSKHVHQQLETNISIPLHRQPLANQLHGTESYFWKLIVQLLEKFLTFYGNRSQQHATFPISEIRSSQSTPFHDRRNLGGGVRGRGKISLPYFFYVRIVSLFFGCLVKEWQIKK